MAQQHQGKPCPVCDQGRLDLVTADQGHLLYECGYKGCRARFESFAHCTEPFLRRVTIAEERERRELAEHAIVHRLSYKPRNGH